MAAIASGAFPDAGGMRHSRGNGSRVAGRHVPTCCQCGQLPPCSRPEAGGRRSMATMVHDGLVSSEKTDRIATTPETAPLRLEEFLPYRLNVVASLVSQALS